jgi:hypothetical protein
MKKKQLITRRTAIITGAATVGSFLLYKTIKSSPTQLMAIFYAWVMHLPMKPKGFTFKKSAGKRICKE